MRRFLLIVLALMLLLGAVSCKAKLDKAKLAGLAFDFVMAQVVSLLDSGEFDPGTVPQLANDLAVEFVVVYADEVPERYRTEVKSFLVTIIPKLIADYMPGLGDDGGRDDDVVRAEAVEMILDNWNAYEAVQ